MSLRTKGLSPRGDCRISISPSQVLIDLTQAWSQSGSERFIGMIFKKFSYELLPILITNY